MQPDPGTSSSASANASRRRRQAWSAIAGLTALGGAAVVASPALAAAPPLRLVEEPRIGGKDFGPNPAQATINVSGYVDFKKGSGFFVDVQVCRHEERVPGGDFGIPDPLKPCEWLSVAHIPISNTCKTVTIPPASKGKSVYIQLQCRFS